MGARPELTRVTPAFVRSARGARDALERHRPQLVRGNDDDRERALAQPLGMGRSGVRPRSAPGPLVPRPEASWTRCGHLRDVRRVAPAVAAGGPWRVPWRRHGPASARRLAAIDDAR